MRLLATAVFVFSATCAVFPARAQLSVTSTSLEIEALGGVSTDNGDLTLARLTLAPAVKARSGRSLMFETKVRAEFAGEETGLGTRSTYGSASKPLELGSNGRIEIDKAIIIWRKQSASVVLGKQAVAWGVLDGVQITDRFDAVRLREGPFGETRPDRLTRWGARARFDAAGLDFDAAVAFDGTVSQFAEIGDAFFVRASRSRGGVPFAVQPQELRVNTPNNETLGLRVSKRMGASDASLLVIHGPDTDPVFDFDGAAAILSYPTRTLFGATFERAIGPTVFRAEAAWSPDQPINLTPSPELASTRRDRILAGVGVDWDMPAGLFLNAQIAADHIAGENLVRPNTDVIATIRLQRSFSNETWRARIETLSVLTDGDGAVRPAIAWRANDLFSVELGADIIWGDLNELIGQFSTSSRAYLRVTAAI